MNDSLRSIVLVVGLVMLVIGEIWLFRVFRLPGESDARIWRYRSRSHPITARLMFPGLVNRALGMTPGQFGRYLGRLELTAAATLLLFVEPLLFVAAPGGPTSMFTDIREEFLNVALPLAAYTTQWAAFAWMWRIHRTGPEPDQKLWRYRADR